MATVALTQTDVTSLTADALVLGMAKGAEGPQLLPGGEDVDGTLPGGLRAALEALGATGREDEVIKIATLGALPGVAVLAVVGLGPAADQYGPEAVRRAAGAASRALSGRRRVASLLALVNGPEPTAELIGAAGEGALLGAYEFTEYKSSPNGRKPAPSAFALATPSPKDTAGRAAAMRAGAVAAAVALCRDLVNTAPNDLPPAQFATRAEKAGLKAGLEVEVLDEKALKKGGYGGILGVGGGSARPPRLVRLRHTGKRPRATVALVGKGITFDSGGISLKPAAGMEAMKSDMAGAAAIVAVMTLAAQLKLPLDVIATVPMAENLPGGSAYRPADVLTMYGGTRVEVLNTDAEGRLILGDAIARACEDGPGYLIETSTLTGAQVVSLGSRTAGVMGSDEFRARVAAAGTRSGEAMWEMPLPAELRALLDSPVADLSNVSTNGSRDGGMLVAGHFLSEFVAEGVQWAHIDVAGPGFNTGAPWGYTHKGGTGVPVRTILAVLEDIAESG